MKKLLGIVVLGLLLCGNANAVPHWLGPVFELCRVNQEIIFYHYTKDEENKKKLFGSLKEDLNCKKVII